MNPWIHKCAVLMAAAGALAFSTEVAAAEKVQKITFIEDDAQKNMASKIYVLKYTKAADIAPFVRGAVVRYCRESNVSTVNDTERNRQLLIVNTGIKMIPYVDDIVAALDRNAKFDQHSNITGNGIAVGYYQPTYRASESMLDIIVKGEVSSGSQDSSVRFDAKRNMFYFKDTPATVDDIKVKLSWLDKPAPAARIMLTVYEVRDSDLKDIGIDYLAWKNGPGMNLFSAGYNALSMHTAEQIIDLLGGSTELLGTATYGFGGFYTAPAFDMSFVRLLQQNGKATISSSANVMVANVPGKSFSVKFAPEYQNIVKNRDHITSVVPGAGADMDIKITNAIITAGKDGVVNFDYELQNSNVVERNNLGVELQEVESVASCGTLKFNDEQIIATWNRTSTVEQTIGVPFLCELPVLKYIFGTTTENTEVTRMIVTARAVPVVYNENMDPGVIAEFDEICKK